MNSVIVNLCSDVRCSIYNDGGQKNDPNTDRLLQKHMCCQYSALCKMLNTILRKATRSFLEGLRNSRPQLQHHLQQPERSGCGHKRILRSSRSSHQWFKNYFWDIAKSHKSKTHRKPANVELWKHRKFIGKRRSACNAFCSATAFPSARRNKSCLTSKHYNILQLSGVELE